MILSANEAPGNSFSEVFAGSVMALGSVIRPEPTNSAVIFEELRPGPLWIDAMKLFSRQPTYMRSNMAEPPGRVCSMYEKYGSSMPAVAGTVGVQV